MAQVFVNARRLTKSQRIQLKIARGLLFVAGYYSIALVGTPGTLGDCPKPGIVAQIFTHIGCAAAYMLYPMTWLGGLLTVYVLVALQTMSNVAMFRWNGARPLRSRANITAVGARLSRNQYLSIIAVPILLSIIVAFGLRAVMPMTLPIKFFPFPFVTPGAIAFGMGIYLGGCADNLKTFLQVLRLPRGAHIFDQVRGFSYEILP